MKDKITNNLILITNKLNDTLQLMNEEKDLTKAARALEGVRVKLEKIINEVDLTNY